MPYIHSCPIHFRSIVSLVPKRVVPNGESVNQCFIHQVMQWFHRSLLCGSQFPWLSLKHREALKQVPQQTMPPEQIN